jgi:hypothetical protein
MKKIFGTVDGHSNRNFSVKGKVQVGRTVKVKADKTNNRFIVVVIKAIVDGLHILEKK